MSLKSLSIPAHPARFLGFMVLTACGGAAGAWLDLPAGWLVGACLLAASASFAGVSEAVPSLWRNLALCLIGLSMGSSITVETWTEAQFWWPSLIIICAGSLIILFIVSCFFRIILGWDRDTAILSALPGALPVSIAIAAEGRGDAVKVAISQSVRLIALLAMIPLVVEFGFDLPAPPPLVQSGLGETVAMAAPALGLGALLARLRFPAAFMLAAMIVSAVAHVTGLVVGRPPSFVTAAAFVVTGTIIGGRFSGHSLTETWRILIAGFVATLLALAVAVALAVSFAWALSAPPVDALLAFAPGGLEGMTSIALALSVDPAFVATNHLVRIFFLSFFIPAFMRYTRDLASLK